MIGLTEGGFSNPPLNGKGGPASRRGMSAFAENLRRDRQDCPPSFSSRSRSSQCYAGQEARQDLALLCILCPLWLPSSFSILCAFASANS